MGSFYRFGGIRISVRSSVPTPVRLCAILKSPTNFPRLFRRAGPLSGPVRPGSVVRERWGGIAYGADSVRKGSSMGDGMKAGASVTGLGATTPLGGDVASTWGGMLDGRSGITLVDEDWAE